MTTQVQGSEEQGSESLPDHSTLWISLKGFMYGPLIDEPIRTFVRGQIFVRDSFLFLSDELPFSLFHSHFFNSTIKIMVSYLMQY